MQFRSSIAEKHFFGQTVGLHGGNAAVASAASSPDGITSFKCSKRGTGVVEMPEVNDS